MWELGKDRREGLEPVGVLDLGLMMGLRQGEIERLWKVVLWDLLFLEFINIQE